MRLSLRPLEIVSKVILRHTNLSTTQRYLGTVSDTEAMRWIEILYDWPSMVGGESRLSTPVPFHLSGRFYR